MKKTLALLTFVVAVIAIAIVVMPKARSTITAAQVAINAPQLLSTARTTSTPDPNLVYISLYSPAGFNLDLNVRYILQIGDQKFEHVCKDPTMLDKTADFCLTQSEFDGLIDGAPIAFRYDERSFVSAKCFGSFNKTQLQITEEYLLCLEEAIPYLTQAKSLLTDSNQITQFDLVIEQMTGLLDTRFWLDPIHLNPEQADEFIAQARTALTTLSTLPDVPLSVDAGHDFGTVSANILSILYTMEGLAGAAMDEGLPPGASDFGDLDERAMSILMKTLDAQKAKQNKDYLAAFDYYVSARQEALSNYVPDDAPKYPAPTTPLSLINADLLYYINSSGDEDSFIFATTVVGNVQISLTNLPANYDLYVYSPTQQEPVGTSTQTGSANEMVSLVNAEPGVYFVRVVPANNDSWDANNSYTLRFDAPNEPTPTPTLTPTVVPTDTPTATATATPTFTPTPFATATSQPLGATFYLHGNGANANPATLFLDSTAPTGATAKYKDSTSINFNNGNPWKEVGTWTAASALTAGQLTSLSDLHVWLGLKNSDDQGTRFDLRAEVYKNGVLVTAGETYCITGITRNANQAKEVAVPFTSFDSANFDGSTDSLSLKILVRIGSDGTGTFCGGHSNAVGIRLYFDATNRAATFSAP